MQFAVLHENTVALEELKHLYRLYGLRQNLSLQPPQTLLARPKTEGLLQPHGSSKMRLPDEITEDIAADAVDQGHMPLLLLFTEHLAENRYAPDRFQEARRRLYAGEHDVLDRYPAQDSFGYARRFARGLSNPHSLKMFEVRHSIAVALEKMAQAFSLEYDSSGPFLDYLESLIPQGLATFVLEDVELFRFLRREKVESAFARVEAIRGLFQGEMPRDPDVLRLNPNQVPIWDFLAVAAGLENTPNDLTLSAAVLFEVLLDGGDTMMDQAARQVDYAPGDESFGILVSLFWGGKIGAIANDLIDKRAEALRQAGFTLLADELTALSRYTRGDTTELTPFLSLREPRPHWEHLLLGLSELSLLAEFDQPPPERLVWVVNPMFVREPLVCRVQKIGTRGDWTPGKKIKLEQLADYVHCMDQHDLKVWRAYQELFEDSWAIYGRNPRALYPALVGHPRLLMHKAEHRRVEFVKGRPTILTEKGENHYTLTLLPWIARSQAPAAEAPGEGQFEIFEADDTYRQIQHLFGEQASVEVPLAEGERIARILNPMLSRQELRWEGDHPLPALNAKMEPGDTTPVVRLWPLKKGLEGCVVVRPHRLLPRTFSPGKGPICYSTKSEEQEILIQRDLPAERKQYRVIKELLNDRPMKNGFFRLALPECCLEFLAALKALPDDSYCLEWPQGVAYRVRTPLDLESLQLKLRSKASWFSVEGSVQLSDQQRIDLLKMLETTRSFPEYVPLDDGSYVQLTESLRLTLRALEAANTSRSDGEIRIHKMSCALVSGLRQVEGDDESATYLAHISEVMQKSYELPSGFCASLRPYQHEGYQWLSRAAELGWDVCLADDMGLGKTVQALALLCSCKDRPNLVVAPTSVASNWKTEATRFAPDLTAHLFSEAADRIALLQSLQPGDLLIASYGLLVNETESLSEISWGEIVLDEAQAIKNHTTRRSKAARSLRAHFRLATTGTPVENHADKLWSLFQFLNHGFLGSKKQYDRSLSAEGGHEAVAKLVRPFILRRLKADVLKDLPPRTDSVMWVEMTDEEKLFYESVRLKAVSQLEGKRDDLFFVLAELTRLRQACCHPRLLDQNSKIASSKLKVLRRLLEDVREAGHAALVFSQFVNHLALAREMLETEGISYLYLDGKTPASKRKKLVDRFQNGEGDVFLISLKAGGTGLNLTRATYVFHLDPWWNPAVEDQASDRAHRIGQNQPVTVYRLIARNTVEQKILTLHEKKRDLANQILEGTENTAKMAPETLLRLFEEGMMEREQAIRG